MSIFSTRYITIQKNIKGCSLYFRGLFTLFVHLTCTPKGWATPAFPAVQNQSVPRTSTPASLWCTLHFGEGWTSLHACRAGEELHPGPPMVPDGTSQARPSAMCCIQGCSCAPSPPCFSARALQRSEFPLAGSWACCFPWRNLFGNGKDLRAPSAGKSDLAYLNVRSAWAGVNEQLGMKRDKQWWSGFWEPVRLIFCRVWPLVLPQPLPWAPMPCQPPELSWAKGSWCWDRASSSCVPSPWGLHGLGTPLAIAEPHPACCRQTDSTTSWASSWWEMQLNHPACCLSLSVSGPDPTADGLPDSGHRKTDHPRLTVPASLTT